MTFKKIKRLPMRVNGGQFMSAVWRGLKVKGKKIPGAVTGGG